MNLEDAKQSGYVDGEDRLVKLPRPNANGRIIVPYGVRSIGGTGVEVEWGGVYHQLDKAALLLPDSVKEIHKLDLGLRLGASPASVTTYSGDDDPASIGLTEGFDFSSVERFGVFPPFNCSYYKEVQEEYEGHVYSRLLYSQPVEAPDGLTVSSDAVFEEFGGGSVCSVRVIGDGVNNVSVDGVLYTDGGEVLVRYPGSKPRVSEFKVPETVGSIASCAFSDAKIGSLLLNSGLKHVHGGAFFLSEIETITIPPTSAKWHYEKFRHVYHPETFNMPGGPFNSAFPIPSMWGDGMPPRSVLLAEGITEIPKHMFYGSYYRGSISIPSTVKVISSKAFALNGGLSVVVPETVERVALDAFASVRSVLLPNSCSKSFAAFADYRKRVSIDLYLEGAWTLAVAGKDGVGISRSSTTIDFPHRAPINHSQSLYYQKLDEAFGNGWFKEFGDKIRVAITRLADAGCPYVMSDAARSAYEAYVKRYARKAAKRFAEEGDVVCVRLLESLGYGAALSAEQGIDPADEAKNAQPKTKKPTASKLLAAAIEAMKNGDASKIEGLAPVSSKVNAAESVRLLKEAAVRGRSVDIDRLFEIVGKFEMPGIALAWAIAEGNEGTARALLANGVTLGPKPESSELSESMLRKYLEDILVEDIGGVVNKAKNSHEFGGVRTWARPESFGWERDVPWIADWHSTFVLDCVYEAALGEKAEPVIAALVNDELLCPKDLKGLFLACLSGGRTSRPMPEQDRMKLAALLADAGALNDEQVILGYKLEEWTFMQRCSKLLPKGSSPIVPELAGIIHGGCSPEVAAAICKLAPGQVPLFWDVNYIKRFPSMVRAMVPFLDRSWFKNVSILLNMLAENGWEEEVRIVCGWKGGVTRKMIEKAIGRASSSGNASVEALLLELNNQLFGKA